MSFEGGEDTLCSETSRRRQEKNINGKKVRNKFLSSCPSIIFDQELFITLVSEMNKLQNYIPMYVMQWPIITRNFKT